MFRKQLKYWFKRLNKEWREQKAALNVSYLPILLALSYPDRIAKRRGEGYVLAGGGGANAHQDYWLNDDFIAIAELGGQHGTHIFSATAVDINQLEAYLPYLFQEKEVCEFNEQTGRFIYENRIMLSAIIIKQTPINAPIDEHIRTSAWIKLIQRKGFALFDCFNHKPAEKDTSDAHQLLTRMTLAHQHVPQSYPAISEEGLLTTLSTWLTPYLSHVNNLAQLKKVDLVDPLKNCLDWQTQTELDALLPKRITVPSGSSVLINYQLDGPAKLSVRMQEVYGLSATPSLCHGKVALLMDLLSPARRSLQLTQDLGGFWQGSYQAIQKEMKGRYPKHFWPDNPAQAKATRKTKAKM